MPAHNDVEIVFQHMLHDMYLQMLQSLKQIDSLEICDCTHQSTDFIDNTVHSETMSYYKSLIDKHQENLAHNQKLQDRFRKQKTIRDNE